LEEKESIPCQGTLTMGSMGGTLHYKREGPRVKKTQLQGANSELGEKMSRTKNGENTPKVGRSREAKKKNLYVSTKLRPPGKKGGDRKDRCKRGSEPKGGQGVVKSRGGS